MDVVDDQRDVADLQADRQKNKKFLKQFKRDLTNVDSPVKDYKKKQRLFKHSPF